MGIRDKIGNYNLFFSFLFFLQNDTIEDKVRDQPHWTSRDNPMKCNTSMHIHFSNDSQIILNLTFLYSKHLKHGSTVFPFQIIDNTIKEKMFQNWT